MRTASKKFNRGFTMFFAVLVSSLALAIGVAIYDLVVRELQLSSTSEQSQYAIYAADTGAECALYWDSKYNTDKSVFPTSTADSAAISATNALCNGVDITGAARRLDLGPNSATTTLTLTFATRSALVQVVKTKVITGSTTVFSHGFNFVSSTTPGAVERELQVSY